MKLMSVVLSFVFFFSFFLCLLFTHVTLSFCPWGGWGLVLDTVSLGIDRVLLDTYGLDGVMGFCVSCRPVGVTSTHSSYRLYLGQLLSSGFFGGEGGVLGGGFLN
ncbi:hypothetical protein GGR50DRAFT_671714 [Xylaria sp. CBS 124048]|nr:hypothetical protein GGR50DRAFT_671714 [Xylaria sp. CBS 124048]